MRYRIICAVKSNLFLCICVVFNLSLQSTMKYSHRHNTIGYSTDATILLKCIMLLVCFMCSLIHCMFYVADILIGVPSLQAHNLDAKIREERCRYLVAELVCRVRIMECLAPVFLNLCLTLPLILRRLILFILFYSY